jgi:hypothetical protein
MEDHSSHVVHMHPAHHPMNWHVFLLFIPAIAFVLTLALIMNQTPKNYAASISEADVLGEHLEK